MKIDLKGWLTSERAPIDFIIGLAAVQVLIAVTGIYGLAGILTILCAAFVVFRWVLKGDKDGE